MSVAENPTHYYRSIHVRRNIYRYEPVPVDEFWDEVKPTTVLVTLGKGHRQHIDVMMMLTGITPRLLSVREHYEMPLEEWNQLTDRYFSYNPVVGAVAK